MLTEITFTIEGVAVPKQSFRAGNGHGYQTPRVIEWQNAVAHAAHHAMFGRAQLAGDLGVEMHIDLPHKRAVDCDNLSKGVLDGMKRQVFADDAQVTELHVYKRQGVKVGQVTVRVWQVA